MYRLSLYTGQWRLVFPRSLQTTSGKVTSTGPKRLLLKPDPSLVQFHFGYQCLGETYCFRPQG